MNDETKLKVKAAVDKMLRGNSLWGNWLDEIAQKMNADPNYIPWR